MAAHSRRDFLQTTLATAVAAFTGASPLGAATAARPYLQNLTQTTATVVWTTLTEGPAPVEFGPVESGPLLIQAISRYFPAPETGLPHGFWLHEAKLTGLTPNTAYRYRVAGESSLFRTPGSGRSRIIAFGDSGAETAEQRQLAVRMTARKPDLILHTGDLVYPEGDAHGYLRKYFSLYEELFAQAPAFPCAGNHDYYHAGGRMFVELNRVPHTDVPVSDRGRYYSFDWENAHIVVLDSNTPLEEAAAGRGEMLEWLNRDLAATRAFWRIAMFHHPPYAGGPNQDDPLSELVRRHIVPILERHSVDLVLSGHEHNYQRSHPVRGIVYLTSGGGGAMIYPPKPRAEAAVQHGRHHYLEAELTPTSLRVDAVSVDGQLLDTLTLRPPPRLLGPLTNAANGSDAVAAGGLVTLMGRSFPAAGMRVLADGQPASVIYSDGGQINFRLPDAISGTVKVRVETPNGAAEISTFVSRTAPAIFGNLIFTASGERVTESKPTRHGERFSVYFTGRGEGKVVTVRIGGAELPVSCQTVQPGVERADFVLDGSGDLALLVDGVASNSVRFPAI